MSGVEALQSPEVSTPELAPMDFDKVAGDVWDRMTVNNGSDRGEGGRFVSPNDEPEAPEVQETVESALEGADKGEGAEKDAGPAESGSTLTESTSVPLPPSWQHRKDTWEKLPPEARQFISETEGEVQRKLSDQGRKVAEYEPLKAVLDEYRHLYEGKIPAHEGIRRLAAAQAGLDNPQTRIQTALSVIDSYPGLRDEIARIVTGQAPAPQSQRQSLTLDDIQRVVRDTVRSETEAERAVRESNEKVASLAKDKPLYAEIPEQTMVQFIYAARSVLSDTASEKAVFDMAYEMATDSIPALKAKKTTPVLKTAVTQKPVSTEGVKRANSVNVPSTSTGKVQAPSLDQALDAIWEKHHR